MVFPKVRGSNLKRQSLTLPNDFQGELNIVLIAFQQWHQALVDSWMPLAKEIEQTIPKVRYYELPTIQRMNGIAQMFINEGMRAGIPNPKTRERTITLYLDKHLFRKALDLPGEDSIYILLIDQQGNVIWQGEGEYTAIKGEALLRAIQSQLILVLSQSGMDG